MSIRKITWSEVHRAAGLLNSDVRVSVVEVAVSSHLHQINLAGSRPAAVNSKAWHQPQRRPNPVASRHFCANLERAVFEVKRVPRVNSCTSDWIDDLIRRALLLTAVPLSLCTLIRRNHNVAGAQESLAENISSKSWLEVKISVRCVRIFRVIYIPLELPAK